MLNSLQRVPGLEMDADAARAVLVGRDIDPGRRPESLTFEEFVGLAAATEPSTSTRGLW